MTSRYIDEQQLARLREHRYDLPRRSLAGRVILVSHGTGAIGTAVSALLLTEGALPVVCYRANRGRALLLKQRMQDLYGGLISPVEGDLSDAGARDRGLSAALNLKDELYGVVLLMNRDDLDGAEVETPRPSLALARECAAWMRKRHMAGAIVLAICCGATPQASADLLADALAEVQAKVQQLARAIRAHGTLRLNAIVYTPTVAGRDEALLASGQCDAWIEGGRVTRFARPEDVARAARFLLEPDAYLHGHTLVLDGGLSLA
ncbi:MAG: SDR family oxidoreductase [Vicinamibacteria bacterium]|jgi:NAD(P)-dependent dehydrogenase (short-subunit alcohol dehydrogenase family)|nr:SDR family oxidoreductase [Vicinamibacteria bacterium]